ncbi:MAG: hypothetical protein ACR2OV_15940 [Hyphomicrobiaceae bacterium]
MTEPTVIQLYETNHRDPVAHLRMIADAIETGEHGHVGCLAVCVFGDTLEVYAAGEDSDSTSAGMVLHAGFMKLSKSLVDHGT